MAIVKVLSRRNPTYSSLVSYVLKYIANYEKNDLNKIYTNNLRSNAVDGFVKEFAENEAARQIDRKDAIRLFHEIVSFSAEENIGLFTQEVIDDLAKEYMRLRGNKAVILGACHTDRKHFHLHFCVSALEYRTGKSFGLNKAQLRELKERYQAYHKTRYPELTKSFPMHGSGERQLTHGQWHAKRREEVIEKVRQLFAQSTTQNQFLDLLRDAGLHHYERNAGKPEGIEYEGARFRFSRLIGKGQLATLPIDRTEEEKALAEIRAVRERQKERDSVSRDIEDRAR